MDWPTLEKLIRQGDHAGVEAALAGPTEAARKALAAPVKQLHRDLPEWRQRNAGAPEGGPLYWEVAYAVTVAGAAVLPPAQLASFLARADYYLGRDGDLGTVASVVRVLLGRDLPTLPGIVEQLATRIGGEWDSRFILVDELVQALDCDPPGADRYLLAWLVARRERVPADLRRRPAWAALIPRLFEVRGGGTLLDDEQRRGTFRQAVEDGVLDRDTLLDAALSALQRGGRPGDQRGYLAWHEMLDPTADEVAARSRQYVSLLAAADLSTAAGMAQQRLRALGEAGRLDLDTALAAARGALARGEKGLVKAQLAWLEQLARREPSRLGDVLAAAAAGFDQPDADLQSRTLKLVGRFAATLPPEQRAQLAGRTAGLPPDLRAEARSLLGGPVPQDEPAAVLSPQVAPAAADRATEPAVASAAELAELAAHFYGSNFDDPLDPTLPERILDGLVRLSWTDRDGVRTALGSALSRQQWLTPGPADLLVEPNQYGHLPRNDIEAAFAATLQVALGPPSAPSRQAAESVTERFGQRPPDHTERLNRLLRFRFAEIAVALSYRPVPFLLSTPTSAAGSLDPEELLHRLDGYARTGVRPLPHDLAQALLRLPADGPARLSAPVDGLDEPLRSGLRSWLDAQPLSLDRRRWTPLEVRRQPSSRPLSLRHERLQGADLVAVSGPAAPDPMPAAWEQAWTVPVRVGTWFVSRWIRVWPGMLPHRRDVVAAHLLLSLLNQTAGGRGAGVVLTDLAGTNGPVDDALRLALAYGLGANDVTDRSSAVDAALDLLARHELDTTALGDDLGSLVVRGVLPLNRLVATAGDIYRASGASQGWPLLAAMLARCLADPVKPPAGIADLLALAVETAQAVHPGGPPDPETVPGLDAVADRPGTSRARTEARRLRSALRPGT